MTVNLDDLYLAWLYEQVAVRSIKERNPARTHWRLLRQLYAIEFVWLIDRDDNRAEDGRALRYEWDDTIDIRVEHSWLLRGCSFLEMLVALSRHLAFEGDGEPHHWFWHLLDNLDLTGFKDSVDFDPAVVQDCADAVIWRLYNRDGTGGLFPLKRTRRDQRRAEIWYQMNEYLLSS